MPYIKEICKAGKTIEINKYYSFRWHTKGEKRENKADESSEAQKRVNQRQAETKLRRLLNNNFEDGDLLITLDFFRENLPRGSDEMQLHMSKAMRKLKALMHKDGEALKYVYVKEVGRKSSRHIHAVINKTKMEYLRKVWPHGGIHIQPLYSNGNYGQIAAYFIKYAIKTEESEGKLIGKRWYGSRNLKKPKVIKKVITSGKFSREAREVKGYKVLPDSISEGVSELTGFEYFSYMMIRTDKKGGGG